VGRRRHHRVAGGLLASVTLVAVQVPPASAVVSKSGSRSCAYGFYVRLTAKAKAISAFTFRAARFATSSTPVPSRWCTTPPACGRGAGR
jgi:hypothetical protein